MHYIFEKWHHISIRIKSFLNIMASHSQMRWKGFRNVQYEWLVNEAERIYEQINLFKLGSEEILPADALLCLSEFIDEKDGIFSKKLPTGNSDCDEYVLNKFYVAVGLIESKMTYYLEDNNFKIRKAVEVAFAHLQRQIIASEGVKKEWDFSLDEPDLEKLGGTHLLSHKIWGFKAHSSGERTDLVLSEHIDANSGLFKSVDGLVLTEWKKCVDIKKIESKIEEAIKQASLYKSGSLYPLELSNYCYIVIVTEKTINLNKYCQTRENTTFRVINIACNPEKPSTEARRKN